MRETISLIDSVKLPLKVRVGSKKISLKELIELKEGEIVELDKDENDYVDLILGEEIIAKAVVIEKNDRFAVEIREIKKSEDK